ncbi:MAG: TIGR02281 family clan AA aspartic protease [Hyphomicrobiaceae bacterium]
MSYSTRIALQEALSWLVAGAILIASFIYWQDLKQTTAAILGIETEVTGNAGTSMPEFRPTRSDPAATTARSSTGGQRVELAGGRHGHFETVAYINGRPIDVLVDTGASLVSLTYEHAQRAGIVVRPSDYRFTARTANGTASFAMVELDRVEIGNIVVRNVRAGVASPGAQHTTLLGMSFLSRLKRFEMRDGRLVLED